MAISTIAFNNEIRAHEISWDWENTGEGVLQYKLLIQGCSDLILKAIFFFFFFFFFFFNIFFFFFFFFFFFALVASRNSTNFLYKHPMLSELLMSSLISKPRR